MIWIQFSTLFQREISRFLKVIMQTIFAPFISSFLYLLVFGVSLGQHVQFKENISYIKKTDYKRVYLWGVEWMYWAKKNNHNLLIWEEAKKLFKF
jgi:hypothetical protein